MMFRLCWTWVLVAGLSECSAGYTYDPDEAKKFAALSAVAYCDDMEHVLSWTCKTCKEANTPLTPGKIRVIDGGRHNGTQIIIGKLRDQHGCVMAFRGSDNLANWLRDLQFWHAKPRNYTDCKGCMVHSGFYNAWENVRSLAIKSLQQVGCSPGKGNKDNLIYITGHSFGAALTHLSMFTLANAGFKIAKSYSFEAPRVGNKAFSDAFTERFSSEIPLFRITHNEDPVVHLPFSVPLLLRYVHVQTEVYYDKSGNYRVCPKVEDPSCADQWGNIPGMLALHVKDHCHSPLVSSGDICGANCAQATDNDASIIV